MTSESQKPQKPPTAAQRASAANRANQMTINASLGRETPPPRDPEIARAAYEERHRSSSHRR